MSVQNMHAYRSFGLKFVWIGRGDRRPLARAQSAAPWEGSACASGEGVVLQGSSTSQQGSSALRGAP